MNIKKPSQKKISKKHINELKAETKCPVHPIFCFKSITSKDDYNFNFFNKDKSRKHEAAFYLIDKLRNLSKKSWEELLSLPKKTAYETLPMSIMNYNFGLGKDEKIISIRFGNGGAYRILGIKRYDCPIFDILGFDFNHSSYNHGK